MANKLTVLIDDLKKILPDYSKKLEEMQCDKDLDQDDVFRFMEEIKYFVDFLDEIKERN